MTDHWWFWVLLLWGSGTVTFAALQLIENRRLDALWAPVWWIALTWPLQLVIVALDLKVDVSYPTREAYHNRKRNG